MMDCFGRRGICGRLCQAGGRSELWRNGALDFSLHLETLFELLQVDQKVFRRLITLLTVLGKSFTDDALEFGWRVGCEPRQRSWLFPYYQDDDVLRSIAFKRWPSRDHFIEHRPQAPDIRAGIDFLSARLLWRHVVDRPQHDARSSANFHHRCGFSRDHRRLPLRQLRDAEVQDLHVSVGPQHDVLWLDVAMHNLGSMSGFQRFRHFNGDRESFWYLQRRAR